jgi:hypothetical protein
LQTCSGDRVAVSGTGLVCGDSRLLTMAHLLSLNCPRCRKQLVYVPLDGLTLHYRCEEHGVWILRPLERAVLEEQCDAPPPLANERPAPTTA